MNEAIPLCDQIAAVEAERHTRDQSRHWRAGRQGWNPHQHDQQLRRLDAALATLRGLQRAGQIGVPTVMAVVADEYSLRPRLLAGDWQRADIVEARHVAMWVARESLGRSLTAIGRAFGGRDHTTVMSAVEKIGKRRAADDLFRARTDRLRDAIITAEKEAQA